MTFLDLKFYIFLPAFLIIYYIIPQKYRYIAILFGSYLFYGYENLKNEISNIADRIDVHDICISGAYIIAKNSTIEELKSEDFVYSAESVLSVPQSKQSFGSYPQTKTWGIEE